MSTGAATRGSAAAAAAGGALAPAGGSGAGVDGGASAPRVRGLPASGRKWKLLQSK
jgi:hypothetical protein